jgi:hypothetical protein
VAEMTILDTGFDELWQDLIPSDQRFGLIPGIVSHTQRAESRNWKTMKSRIAAR